jgi:hypothetical protein
LFVEKRKKKKKEKKKKKKRKPQHKTSGGKWREQKLVSVVLLS